jgi:hypothetical protein
VKREEAVKRAPSGKLHSGTEVMAAPAPKLDQSTIRGYTALGGPCGVARPGRSPNRNGPRAGDQSWPTRARGTRKHSIYLAGSYVDELAMAKVHA